MLRDAVMPSRNAASASDDRFAARRILARSSAMPARIRFPPAARANSAARDIASSACAVCLRWTAMKASRSVSSAWYPSEPSFAASAKVVVTSSSASDTRPTFTSASALPTSVMKGIRSSGTVRATLSARS